MSCRGNTKSQDRRPKEVKECEAAAGVILHTLMSCRYVLARLYAGSCCGLSTVTDLQQRCQGAPHTVPAEADLAARDGLQVVLRQSTGRGGLSKRQEAYGPMACDAFR